MNKEIIVNQIVKMLKDYEGCEKVKVINDYDNIDDILILGYFEYDENASYNDWDFWYSLEFDENGNLIYLNNRDK
jgi:hypothetical protein